MLFTSRSLVAEFFHDRLRMPSSGDLRGALYVREEFRHTPMQMDSIGVGLAYNNFNGRTCAIHIVVQDKRCLTRQVVREAFDYPFIQCGLTAIVTSIDSKNEESIELARRVGFREVYRVREGGTDGDLLVMEMRHDECRWIKRSQ